MITTVDAYKTHIKRFGPFGVIETAMNSHRITGHPTLEELYDIQRAADAHEHSPKQRLHAETRVKRALGIEDEAA